MEGCRLMNISEQGFSELNRQVVIIAGAPGAGKTELSGMIARTTGYPRLEKDLLAGRSGRTRAYRTLMDLAADIASNGSSVILDAGFLPELSAPGWVQRNEQGFGLLGARLHVVLVEAAQDVREDRMRLRGIARDAARLSEPQYQPAPSRKPSCTVNNAAGIFDLMEQAQTVVSGLGLRRDT